MKKPSKLPKLEISQEFVDRLLDIIGDDLEDGEPKEEQIIRDDESAA